MAIRVVCPECGSAYAVDDQLRGKKIRCKSCQTPIAVGTAAKANLTDTIRKEPPAPRVKPAPAVPVAKRLPSRGRRDDDFAEDDQVEERPAPRRRKVAARPEQSKLPLLLLVGGGVGLVLLIVVGVVIAIVLNSGSNSKSNNAVSQSNAPSPAVFPPPGPNRPAEPPKQANKEKQAEEQPVALAGGGADLSERIYKRLLKSTVLIVTPLRIRGRSGFAIGSGTLIDKKNLLVLTNYHVIAGATESPQVYFPIYKNGERISKREDFQKNIDAPKHLLKGTVLRSEKQRDLALVKLDRLPSEGTVEALPLAKSHGTEGAPVYSVGNAGDSDAVFIFTTGKIRTFLHQTIAVGGGEEVFNLDADSILTDSPINGGDSGGPLVNGRAELIGVTESKNTRANLLSIFIDVKEVRAFLDKCADQYDLKYELPNGPGIEGNQAGMGELAAALTETDVKKRRDAAVRLGEFGSDAKMAVPFLIRALKDKDEVVRQAAEESLQKIGPATGAQVPALVRLLDDTNMDVRLRTLDALGKIGSDAQPATEPLLKALKDSDAHVRSRAAWALGKVAGKSRDTVAGPLSEALKDNDKEVRAAAATALANDLPLTAGEVPMLLELLQHSDAAVKAQGALALKKLGPDAREAKKPLLGLLKSPDTEVRRAALSALAEIGPDKDAIPALKDALQDKDAAVRGHALEAAGKLGADAKPIVSLVADGLKDWRNKKQALDALARIGPPARDPKVLRMLNETLTEKKYRAQALDAIAAIGANGKEGAVVVKNLVTLIEEKPNAENKEVRDKAVKALGKTGKNALVDLEKSLADSRPWVRMAAASALGEMGSEARRTGVVQRLAYLQTRDDVVEVREAATEALKKIQSR